MIRRRQRSVRRARSAYRSPFLYGRKPLFEMLEDRRLLAVITVDSALDNVNDDGLITLREAIIAANTNAIADATEGVQTGAAGLDEIHFAIPGAGPHTISLASALPTITESVIIDGFTEMTGGAAAPNTNPTNMPINATMLIVVDGGGGTFDGFTIDSGGGGSTIRGLVIQNFDGNGVSIVDSDDNFVIGNFIGTNVDGDGAAANVTGVSITGTSMNNAVGGVAAADRNLISGNTSHGVFMSNGATMNDVLGNFIGSEADGTTGLGNGANGVWINDAANNNTVGGTTDTSRNVIVANNVGVRLNSVSGVMVQGNYIGLDRTGEGNLGNSADGVVIEDGATNNTIGGTTPSARNIISGNNSSGVQIQDGDTTGNVVSGNYIGTSASGNADRGNFGDGVRIRNGASNNTIGGTASGAGNLISGNDGDGVDIRDASTTGNLVQGNFIGLDHTGTVAIANSDNGVQISNEASNNTVGGTTAGARNIISGNNSTGVQIQGSGTSGNMVQGNYIGTTADGMSALGNSGDGVRIQSEASNNSIGGTAAGAGNLISANRDGVDIRDDDTDGNTVQGNRIGTDADGTGDLGNSDNGVQISNEASNNTVGGTADGAGNIITFNDKGVVVEDDNTINNAITRNSIRNNDNLGIDLGDDGMTPNDFNDPDEGPNRIQNYPVFVGNATLLGNSIALRYRVDTATANATYPLAIEFFVADSDNQEGQTYLATDMYVAGEAGTTKMVVIPAPAVITNNAFLATATDADGNTSEFSFPVQIVLPTILGSEPTLIRPEERININQVNQYQYIAHSTGKMVVRIDFLHLFGDLDLEVRDEFGNLLATSNSSSADQNYEQVILPVVTQERYFISVIAVDFNDDIGTSYALEVENFPAPVPSGVHLDPLSDTGMMNNDGVTMDKSPTFFIQTDVFNFVDTNNDGIYVDPDFIGPPAPPAVGHDSIDALNAAQAQAILDGMPMAGDESGGIAVQVSLVNVTTGELFTFFADPVIAAVPDVYRLDVPDGMPLTAGTYMVAARTFVFDGQGDAEGEPDQAMGRSNASPPLWFTIDCEIPYIGSIDLLSHSDSGMYDDDHVTNKMSPAFYGIGEANAKVRVFAQRTDAMGMPVSDYLLVGSGVVGSDSTYIVDDEPIPLGAWEVTVEPLIDGKYNFYAVFEDAAGNISDPVGLSPDPILMTDVNMPIPDDGTPVNSTIEVTPANFPGIVGNAADMVVPILDVNVTINIEHPNDEDLTVILIAPDGITEIVLTSGNGGDGDNYTNTVFDDSASTSITTGVAPFTGRFIPEEPLSVLNGISPFGDWTLRVIDDAGNAMDGPFLNWTLDIDVPLMVVIDTVAPNTPFLDLQSGPTVNSIQFVNDPTLGTITDVDVTINIAHPHVADLEVYLISPEGTRVLLTSNNGGNGADYTNTEFDDAAAVSIVNGTAPFTGTFRPEGSLADFNGEDPFGVWTLEVTDDFQPFEGQLLNWTLDITATLGNFTTTSNDVLAISSDTGRHDHDNVTKDNMPTVTMTSSDLNTFATLLWTDNFKFRIYDRFQDTAEFLLYDSALDMDVFNIEDPDDVFTALTFITEKLPNQFFDMLGTNAAVLAGGVLADGVHNLKLEVEDRAGNISPDFILEITVDTQTPPVSFGLPDAADDEDGLAADSDTGVTTMPMTYSDRITSDTTPRLWGRAEANSIVRVFLDNPLAGTIGVIDLNDDIFLGQTVALPFDGNDAYPDGYWELDTALDLNEIYDMLGLAKDGLRQLLVTAEDLAGNGIIDEGVGQLDIFIDTQGPQVLNVYAGADSNYDLFDPKPSENGYTPLVFDLQITIQDLPERTAAFLYQALKLDIADAPGNYLLVGDHVGPIAIDNIAFGTSTQVGDPAFTFIGLYFDSPLPDDRYTLTISDNLVDPAGNHLDGESNAVEPQEDPQFPSGDGVPGGDFVARFTVDSRPEIGSYVSKDIDIDINGNFVWDPANAQIGNDTTNVDLSFTLPVANADGTNGLGGFGVHDLLFAGKFRPLNEDNGENDEAVVALNGDGNHRYFDQLAAYGFSGQLGVFRWIIDTNSDGVVTLGTDILVVQSPLVGFDVASAIPVAGNFDGDLYNGDEIGLYNRGTWALDTNHDYVIDTLINGNMLGQPIVGDFDGNGEDDLGVFNNNEFFFDLNTGGFDGFWDQKLVLGFPGVLDKPVAADMDGDGIDDIGLWVPRTSASPPRTIAEWYFWISNDYTANNRIFGTINTLDHAFTVVPFGNDIFAEFGDERALPIVGNFDPPVSAAASSSTASASNSTSSSTQTSSTAPVVNSVVETSAPATTAPTVTPSTDDTTSTAVVETEEVADTPAVTVAAETQSDVQSETTTSTPTTTPSTSSTSSSKSTAAPVAQPVVKTVAQTATTPTSTSKVSVNLKAAIAAYQTPAKVKLKKAAAPSQPVVKPVAEPISTPVVAKETVATPAVEPVVAPVTVEVAKQAAPEPITTASVAPVKSTGKTPVNLQAAIAAYQKPAAATVVKATALSTVTTVASAPAAAQFVITAQAPLVSSLEVQAPANLSTGLAAKVPTIKVDTPMLSVESVGEATALSFSVVASSIPSLESATAAPVASPLAATLSLSEDLLLLSGQANLSGTLVIHQAIGEFGSEDDEILDDLSLDSAADDQAEDALAVAWQDWDVL
jgi:subtilisin-like proprotein convertase family protein